MSRISNAFSAVRKAKRAALITYITAGDPTLERTIELATALREAGADILELGVPFSDPIADGRTNQQAAERALRGGTGLPQVLAAVDDIRAGGEEIPIVLFTYANPVLRYGVDQFSVDAATAGVDGVLFTDVPVEELDRFRPILQRKGIEAILLAAPTSSKQRIKAASRAGGGFLYYVSRTGVTGVQTHLQAGLEREIRAVRKISRLPVAVGFGISGPDQVAAVAKVGDGVVVGSAIVDRIACLGDSDELAGAIQSFVGGLAEACSRR